MTLDNVLVRPHLQQVETFSKRDRWNTLSTEDLETVVEQLADLPNSNPQESRFSKEFDLLCLKLQLSILERQNSFERLLDQVRDTLAALGNIDV
jgi:type I restriction enzyme, R subunit